MTTHDLESTARRSPGLVSVDGRTYPLRSAKLTSHAENAIASSRLAQTFANPYDQPLEVVYTMPLPADGAVIGYTIRMGERVIHGVVEPREKASAAYFEALAEGRTAALLEQDRDDTFQQRLGNLPPRVEAEVEIQVLHPLAFVRDDAGAGAQWEFRFPTVVGVRYEGGPGRVADAGRLGVDRDGDGGIPVRLGLEVVVGDPTAARITSPTHAILAHWESGRQHVELAARERLDRDLVIRWNACTNECGARLAIGGGVDGDDGRYGLVTITPPEVRGPAFSRDLTVLLDASGSMTGEPLAMAKAVVKELLESLEPGDRFELLAFSNRVERLGGPLRFATEDAVASALRHLTGLEAGGATEMTRAMIEALRPLRDDSQRQVVLVSDGQIGFESEVAATVRKGLPPNCRAHTVGVGAAPNRTLTSAVARVGRGVEVLVGHAAGVGAAARRLCAATAAPILTEVSIGGAAVREVATQRLRDVFAGQPLLALVELAPAGGVLEVRGRLAGRVEPWVASLDVAALGEGGWASAPLPLGALFGREKVADLEMSLADFGSHTGAFEKIEAVAMRHRITSRRTSLVAIAEQSSVEPGAEPRRERLALELPAGVSAEGSGLFGGDACVTMSSPADVLVMARRIGTNFAARFSLDAEDDGDVLRSPGAQISRPAGGFGVVVPTPLELARRRLDSLRDSVRRSEALALRLRWLVEKERGGDEEVAGLVEGDATALAEIRRKIDELKAVLEVVAAPDDAAATPAWAAPLARLTEECERLLNLADGLVPYAAYREGGEDMLRTLYEGLIAANLRAVVTEIEAAVGSRAEHA